MSLRTLFLVTALAAAGQAQAAQSEVAVLLGTPDLNQPFVRNILVARQPVWSGPFEDQLTTYAFSMLEARGVKSATSVEFVSTQGSADQESWMRAIDLGGDAARVVINLVGGTDEGNDIGCRRMAMHPGSAYVFGAKSVDLRVAVNCQSPNILFVAALNDRRDDLAPFTNGGPAFRLASPGMNVLGVTTGGRPMRLSGGTPSASIVAARLVEIARENPLLSGAQLIDRFLAERATALPRIADRVAGGRAILD